MNGTRCPNNSCVSLSTCKLSVHMRKVYWLYSIRKEFFFRICDCVIHVYRESTNDLNENFSSCFYVHTSFQPKIIVFLDNACGFFQLYLKGHFDSSARWIEQSILKISWKKFIDFIRRFQAREESFSSSRNNRRHGRYLPHHDKSKNNSFSSVNRQEYVKVHTTQTTFKLCAIKTVEQPFKTNSPIEKP